MKLKNSCFALLIIIAATCSVSTELHAQASAQVSDSTLVQVSLLDGTKLIGFIVSETADRIEMELRSGSRLTFNKSEVGSIKSLLGDFKDGKHRRLDPNTSRLAFGATGRPVKKGEGYVSFNYLFFPFVGYGISDRLTATVGVSILPFTSGQLIYAAPKFAVVNEEKIKVSFGFFGLTGIGGDGWDDVPGLGLAFGSATYGSEYSAVTAGFGYGVAEGTWADSPLILIGFEHQLSNSLKLLSENYFIPEIDGITFSIGLRFFGEKLSSDFLLVSNTEFLSDSSGFPFIPYFGFAYNFGR